MSGTCRRCVALARGYAGVTMPDKLKSARMQRFVDHTRTHGPGYQYTETWRLSIARAYELNGGTSWVR